MRLTPTKSTSPHLQRLKLAIADERKTVHVSMLLLALQNNPNAPALFAPRACREFQTINGQRVMTHGKPALHEVMAQAFALPEGPEVSQLIAIFLKVANGEAPTAQALDLLSAICLGYAKHLGKRNESKTVFIVRV